MSTGFNYIFGFLVASGILCVWYVSRMIIQRRRYRLMLAEGALPSWLDGESSPQALDPRKMERPVFWDVHLVEGKEEAWDGLQVCCTPVRAPRSRMLIRY